MSEGKQKQYRPYNLKDSAHLTPDSPEFYSFGVNIAILTKYGRGIYIRHGNEDRCSSFFATLGTIVNKLELSFGKANEEGEQPASTLSFTRPQVHQAGQYLRICPQKAQLSLRLLE